MATLKLEEFDKMMLESAELAPLFNLIKGWDKTDSCTKEVIVKRTMSELKVESCDSVLVGDSIYDAKGAKFAYTGR